jgi:hypothetical protein
MVSSPGGLFRRLRSDETIAGPKSMISMPYAFRALTEGGELKCSATIAGDVAGAVFYFSLVDKASSRPERLNRLRAAPD